MNAIPHAEVIGSLLRPHYLSRAREALETGGMQPPEFKRVEDSAVDEGIALQQGCGLDVITDGELRRFSFLDQLLAEVEGVTEQEGAAVTFHGRGGESWDWHPNITVTGKFRGTRMLTLEEFIYARARAVAPVKVTLPSPLVLYGAWSPELSTAAYKDAYEMFIDAADVIRAEIRALARLGCTYVQIDSPDLGTLVDPENRALRESLGMPTERTLTEGVDIINCVCDVPGVTFGLHLCKGNYQSKWIATGGYDDTAKAIFGRMPDVDVFLLEYDDERSGSFEPLKHVPDDKRVVLGLVSSKTTEIEAAGEIVARVNEAAKYVDLERLGLSTQCGFASVSIGANLINAGTQQAKLELVGEAARQIWSLRQRWRRERPPRGQPLPYTASGAHIVLLFRCRRDRT
jgi:5-methyltetrahydropteroyltriglutamate--homocysteine methyltransferase